MYTFNVQYLPHLRPYNRYMCSLMEVPMDTKAFKVSHTNPFARRYSHHVFLHREPHCLSDQPHVVQVAAVLALVCVWSAELHRRNNKHRDLLPHVAVLSPTPHATDQRTLRSKSWEQHGRTKYFTW